MTPQCDLNHPICSYCQRTGKVCRLGVIGEPSSSASASNRPTNSTSPGPAGSPSSAHHNNAPTPTIPIHQIPLACMSCTSRDTHFSYRDLELMHHYTTLTAINLEKTRDPLILDTWRIGVPREAIRHPFLMHTILALAALHKISLASTTTTTNNADLALVALNHHHRALSLSKPAIDNFDATSANAIFAFSAIGALVLLAMPVYFDTPPLADPITDISALGAVMRGTSTVVRTGLHWITSGPLAAQLRLGFLDRPAPLPPETEAALGLVDEAIKRRFQGARNAAELLTSYSYTLDRLKLTFGVVLAQEHEKGIELTWLAMGRADFAKQLEEREGLALVLLAHYAVLLHGARDVWCCKGWGRALVEAIGEALPPEGGWEGLMAWPRKEVGLDGREEQAEGMPGFGELVMEGDEMGSGSMAASSFFGPLG